MADIELISSRLLDSAAITHGFTTRSGGVSEGAFGSLNLTRSRGDEAANVSENRRRLAEALGLDHLAFATQVHGRAVARLTGPPKGEAPVGEADAIITDRPGVGLVAQTADCTPVLLFDPAHGAIGAIHSGWRGTVQNVVGATIAAMGEAYGTRPGDLLAAIGPSVSQVNYRVGAEVLDQFQQAFGALEGAFIKERDAEGGGHLDVALGAERQLLEAGVPAAQIDRSTLCTYADETRFFSARRSHHRGESGVFGGQGGVIGLR